MTGVILSAVRAAAAVCKSWAVVSAPLATWAIGRADALVAWGALVEVAARRKPLPDNAAHAQSRRNFRTTRFAITGQLFAGAGRSRIRVSLVPAFIHLLIAGEDRGGYYRANVQLGSSFDWVAVHRAADSFGRRFKHSGNRALQIAKTILSGQNFVAGLFNPFRFASFFERSAGGEGL